MESRHVLALGHDEPPHTDHGPVLLAHVPVIIQHTCHMTVAIVTADIVHALPIRAIRSLDILIEFGKLMGWDVQLDILVRLSKGKVILTDVVRPSKVINDTICACDACMTNHWQEPGDSWKWRPCDAQGEAGVLSVHLGNSWHLIGSVQIQLLTLEVCYQLLTGSLPCCFCQRMMDQHYRSFHCHPKLSLEWQRGCSPIAFSAF